MSKRLRILGLILLSTPGVLNAQALLPDDYHAVKIAPSPTASGISRYQEIPVDLFTGTPSITVPLTSIDYGGIHVPVTLSYHSTGIKVAEHPGWAGLGWDVITGGQITRKVNWIPDEYYNRHPNIPSSPLIDHGYYFLGNMLNTPNWNTPDQLKSYAQLNPDGTPNTTLQALTDGEPDEFSFSFGSYSGTFYLSETGQWKVKCKENIQFEIQSEVDTSANYRLFRDFDILTGAYTDSSVALNTGFYEYVSSLFTKFTIITPDGYKYEFGGDKSAIEFSRGSIPNTSGGGDGLGPFEDRRNNITANTWNLTKITAPTGEIINFNYQRGKVIFTENRYFSLWYDLENPTNSGANTGSSGDVLSYTASATNPSYLASIETPSKKIEFIKSTAVELPIEPVPEYLLPPGESASQFVMPLSNNWKDLSYAFYYPNTSKFPNNNQQLDSIKVFDKLSNSYVNGIKFFQRADATKRRTLDSIAFYDVNSAIQKYQFQYAHVDDLPFYESLRRDHWGYFNGGTEPTGPGGWPNRLSNTLSTYGMISKIIYPTGGETDFEFEPGYYGNVVHVDPNDAQPISLTVSSGSAGVRIKTITSNANNGSPVTTTQYYYKNDFANGGNNSSGVLTSEPRYVDQIQFDNGATGGLAGPCGGHFYLNNSTDDNSEWMNQAKGGIVTYSEVAAVNSDGSFITTKYTNNDNVLYQDEMGQYYNFGGNTTVQSNYRLTSNDLERGKILSQTSYNSAGGKVKELLYTYENDPARKNQFAKCFAKKVLMGAQSFNDFCPGPGLGGGIRLWTYKIYSYQNPIKTLTETTYENSQPITETKTFSYDTYGNVTRTVSSRSDVDVEIEDVQYNVGSNFQGTATSGYATRLKNLFTTYRIKNFPVERTTTLRQAVNPTVGNDRMISGTLYEYDNVLPLLSRIQAMELASPYYTQTYSGGGGGGVTYNYLPASINASGNFVYDGNYKPQVTINNYTLNITGTMPTKPVAVTKVTGTEAYTWDYNLGYLTSFTTNCLANQAAFTSFEGTYLGNGAIDFNNGNWQFYSNMIIAGGVTGGKCINFIADNAQQRLTSNFSIPANQQYILSFWYKDKYPTIKQGSQSLGVNFNTADDTWKYVELPFTGNGNPLTLSIGTPVPNFPTNLDVTYLDEVRLYPLGSSMKSYTYDTKSGLPSAIDDGSGKINYYEYDNFGRLINVKDKQGNIISSNSYQYQGPQ